MKKKNNKVWALWTVIGVIGVLAISLSAFAYTSMQAPKYVNEGGGVINVTEAPTTVENNGDQMLGAAASPDFMTNWISVGGVRLWAKSVNLTTASSTLCSIQAPAATSTLIMGSMNVRTGTTSGMYLEFGKGASNTNTSTTTSLGIITSVAANAFGTFVASTTQSGADQATTFAPNTWFVAKFSASDGTVYTSAALTGRCKALWIENVEP